MYFTWESAFDTGIDVIDEQHRRIVDYINHLHMAIATKELSAVPEVLDQLINYTISHFSFEESLMESHGYQHTVAHRKVHEMFTDRVRLYAKEWSEDKDISRKLLNDLKIWLVSHIKSEDRDYVSVIQTKVDKGWVAKALERFFGK